MSLQAAKTIPLRRSFRAGEKVVLPVLHNTFSGVLRHGPPLRRALAPPVSKANYNEQANADRCGQSGRDPCRTNQ